MLKSRFRFVFACLVSFWVGFAPLSAQAQSADYVREIIVEGIQRIEPATVRSYLLIQEGDGFSSSRIDRSLKSLFATGLFSDVKMSRRGDTLVVTVVENPIINRIAFEGNQQIPDEELESEVILRPRVIYTRTKVQNDLRRILTLYQRSGRYAATIEPKVIRLAQNRVDLVFEINEGEETGVRRIRFVGNSNFDDSDLRSVIRTAESRWYKFFSSDDTYDPDRLTLDKELLRRFYLNEGFADIQVQSAVAELTPDKRDFFITFTIDEGARYQFGSINVESRLRGLEAEQVRPGVDIEQGEWYNAGDVEDAVDQLIDDIGNLGFSFIDVRPRTNRDREAKTIDIIFEVSEGPRVFVERIDITGNVRTIDDVIRREFRLVEGDAFNAARLRRSRQRLQNLDFFENVNIQRRPGSSSDKTTISVEVEEKSTGSLSLGAGFSTTNGALFDASIRERNLLGRGQDLNLKVVLAQKRSQIELGFTEPWFMGRDVSAGFDIFHTNTDFQDASSFDSRVTGGDLRLGYPVSEDVYQSWKYTFQESEVRNVDEDASLYIKATAGTRTLSELSHTLTLDRRDSRLSPTEGYFVQLGNDLAGLGGTARYLRNRINGSKYYSVYDDWVVSLSGSAGYIFGLGKDVHILDRFFVGGDDLRGFATAGIGPRDSVTQDALGGEWMYSGSIEMGFPLGLPDDLGVRGKVFSDFGSSGTVNPSGENINDTSSIRVSIGAGIVWVSPFGPIGVDFGFPVIYEDFDQIEYLRINFGTRF